MDNEAGAVVRSNGSASLAQSGNAQPIGQAEIRAYGLSVRIPLPKWAIAALSVFLVIALVTLGGYVASVYVLNKQWLARSKVSEYAENYKHSLEGPELKESQLVTFLDGTTVTVNHFKSDGCNQIVRHSPLNSKTDGIWMFGPLLAPDKQSAIGTNNEEHLKLGRKNPDLRASLADPDRAFPGSETDNRLKLIYVQGQITPEEYKEVQYGGRCLNPHPGPWNEKPEPVGQCATRVWRYFADGCIHFQFFNPCTGTWDVLPNGAPNVTWTRCIH